MSQSKRKKDFDYFGCFENCAKLAYDAAIYLHQSVENFNPAKLEGQTAEMHRIENNADMLKHEMLTHLSHEFLPPIEAEDIVTISMGLDDVVDTIEEVMRRLYMFNVQSVHPEAAAFTELIVQSCKSLVAAVTEFRHFKKSKSIQEHIIAVNALENEGDKLYAESMRKLFTSQAEWRDTMVWTTMLDCVEDCLDCCEDVADMIESVIMKNT